MDIIIQLSKTHNFLHDYWKLKWKTKMAAKSIKFCFHNLDGNSKNKNYANIIWQHYKNTKYMLII